MSAPGANDYDLLGYSVGIQNKPTNKIRRVVFKTEVCIRYVEALNRLAPSEIGSIVQVDNPIDAIAGQCFKVTVQVDPVTGVETITKVSVAWAGDWVSSRTTTISGSTGGS